MNFMKKNLHRGFVMVLLLSVFTFAQKTDQPQTITEFPLSSNLEWQELQSDMFANELMRNVNSTGYIEVFGKEIQSKGVLYFYTTRFSAYLTKIKKIAPDRVVAKVCSGEGPGVRFTLVPSEADYKGCSENISFDLSRTFLFVSYNYSTPNEYGGCCIIGAFNREEAEASLKAISEVLKKSPESKVHLTAYTCLKCQNSSGKFKADLPSLADKILNDAKQMLSKNKIEDSRIMTSKGKTEAFRGVDIWFVPKGGEIPKPKPNSFPKKNK